jgi:hypothetical protein
MDLFFSIVTFIFLPSNFQKIKVTIGKNYSIELLPCIIMLAQNTYAFGGRKEMGARFVSNQLMEGGQESQKLTN